MAPNIYLPNNGNGDGDDDDDGDGNGDGGDDDRKVIPRSADKCLWLTGKQ